MVNSFSLTVQVVLPACSFTQTTTLSKPSGWPITSNQFSVGNGSSTSPITFNGTFSSATAASGTYSFVNQSSPCGTWSQVGTWTATLP